MVPALAGVHHAGVHLATVGWILPMLRDPDGHEVRFSTIESHTEVDPRAPLVVGDAVASARVAEAQWLLRRAAARDAAELVP